LSRSFFSSEKEGRGRRRLVNKMTLPDGSDIFILIDNMPLFHPGRKRPYLNRMFLTPFALIIRLVRSAFP